MTAHLDVDALLADRDTHIIVCCGSGGVGGSRSTGCPVRSTR